MTNGPLAAVLRHLQTWVGVTNRASLTDSQLLEEYVLRREETAFAALVERHAPLVFGVCRRMLSHDEDAADAFQATFLVFARRASSIRRRQSLAAWLHGVARRVALKARLQTSRRRDASQRLMDATVPKTGPDTADQLAQREATAVLDEELQGLPEKYRLPLILCYFQGRTYEEAAEELGLPSGSMGKRLNQAQDRLRERLLRRGVTMSATALAAMLTGSAQAVPPMLATEAAKAALLFVAGKASAGVVSERVVSLAQGVLQSFWLGQVKMTAFAAAAMVFLLGGGTMLITAMVPNPPKTQAVTVPADPEPLAVGPKSWQEQAAKTWNGEFVTAMAMAPDGKTLAIGRFDGTAVLLDTSNGREIGSVGTKKELNKELKDQPKNGLPPAGFPAAGQGGALGGGAIGLNPQAVGGFGGGMGAIGNVGGGMGAIGNAGGGIGGFGGMGQFTCLAFSPNGKQLAAANAAGGVDVWDVATRRADKPITIDDANRTIQSMAYAPDGASLVAAGSKIKNANQTVGWVKQWDMTGKVLASYEAESPSSIRGLSFAPDGWSVGFTETQLVPGQIGSLESPVKVLDLKTSKVIWQSDPKTDGAVSLVADPTGKVLSITTTDSKVQVWDTARSTFRPRFKPDSTTLLVGGFGQGSPVAFSPDGKQFAMVAADDEDTKEQGIMLSNAVHFCDTATGKVIDRIKFGHGFSPLALVYSTNGQTLAVAGMKMEIGNQPQDDPFAGLGGGFGRGGIGGGGFGMGGFGAPMQGEVKFFSLKPAGSSAKSPGRATNK
jgi:RNA polymerase sigma factor (sigma-70 family)